MKNFDWKLFWKSSWGFWSYVTLLTLCSLGIIVGLYAQSRICINSFFVYLCIVIIFKLFKIVTFESLLEWLLYPVQLGIQIFYVYFLVTSNTTPQTNHIIGISALIVIYTPALVSWRLHSLNQKALYQKYHHKTGTFLGVNYSISNQPFDSIEVGNYIFIVWGNILRLARVAGSSQISHFPPLEMELVDPNNLLNIDADVTVTDLFGNLLTIDIRDIRGIAYTPCAQPLKLG